MTLQSSQNHKYREARVFVDAHVHIHDCFDLQAFLSAASTNFAKESARNSTGGSEMHVLCLTETKTADKFGEMISQVDSRATEFDAADPHWRFQKSGDELSVIARHPNLGELLIVAGRQVATREALEVLMLGSLSRWNDGLPAKDVIELALGEGSIPILPWGFGKWLGRRRQVVESLIDRFSHGSLFLGDNSGRPWVIPFPAEFKRAEALGLRILRGTDPLPFRSEYNRAGSFGFYVDGVVINDGVWTGLRTQLMQSDVVLHNFGSLEVPYRFVRNQFAMQVVTRLSKRTADSYSSS